MKSPMKRVTVSTDPTGGTALAWQECQEAPAITISQEVTFGPAISPSPQVSPGSASLVNKLLLQDIDTSSASILALAGLLHMIASHHPLPAPRVRLAPSRLPQPL